MDKDPGKVECPQCEGLGVEDPEEDIKYMKDCSLCEGDGIVKEAKAKVWKFIENNDDIFDESLIEELLAYPMMPEEAFRVSEGIEYPNIPPNTVKPYSEEDKAVLQKLEDKMWYREPVPGTSIKNPCCEITTNPGYNAVKNNYKTNDDYSIFLR